AVAVLVDADDQFALLARPVLDLLDGGAVGAGGGQGLFLRVGALLGREGPGAGRHPAVAAVRRRVRPARPVAGGTGAGQDQREDQGEGAGRRHRAHSAPAPQAGPHASRGVHHAPSHRYSDSLRPMPTTAPAAPSTASSAAPAGRPVSASRPAPAASSNSARSWVRAAARFRSTSSKHSPVAPLPPMTRSRACW